ncbi:MAG: DUF2202 domain-containing protein [Halanaeroarchaeum sp.]
MAIVLYSQHVYMDRRQYLGGIAGIVAGTAIAGCLGGPSAPSLFVQGTNGASSVDNEALDEWLASASTGDLTETERADLRFMREEEKVARDVYLVLADEWGLQVHTNIAESEQSHMDAMLSLIELYDQEDPATDTIGEFTNHDLQALFDTLVAWGKESTLASLKVGCRIEEKDIRDIQIRIDRTDEEPIDRVYENLVKGSRNHLRAFYRVLTRRGGTYDPVIISQEKFDEIVNSDWETGAA